MVKLSDYNNLKNWETANKALGNKDSKTIGNNTKLHRRNNGNIVVKLHGHVVVKYERNGGTRVSSANHTTSTTKDRINRYTPKSFRVVQRDYTWYAKYGDTKEPFTDGMYI